MYHFQGKTALVTWASSWLWASLCQQLAQRWANVFAVARSMQSWLHKNIIPIVADITKTEEVRGIYAQIGPIDFLINNAGIWHTWNVADLTDEDISTVISTNLVGMIQITRGAVQRMLKQDTWGNIAFISSLAGKMGFPGLSVYSATKFWMEGFVESLNRENEENDKIRTTVVHPGMIRTNFFENAGMPEVAEKFSAKLQEPTYVAGKVLEGILANKRQLTVWKDWRIIPLLRFLPKKLVFKLLPYLT